MAIYLVQHGEALPEAQDPQRGLSETGRSETRRTAEVAASYSVQVTQIQHSGKKRALQTAEIIAELLRPERGRGRGTGAVRLPAGRLSSGNAPWWNSPQWQPR